MLPLSPNNRTKVTVPAKSPVRRGLQCWTGLGFIVGLIDGFCSVLYVEFLIDPVNMLADGAGGNAELVGDFLIQKSLGKQMQGFIFPVRKSRYTSGCFKLCLILEISYQLTGDIGPHWGAALIEVF